MINPTVHVTVTKNIFNVKHLKTCCCIYFFTGYNTDLTRETFLFI